MTTADVLSRIELVLANQQTILQKQALILKGQEEILAAQRHCMYREALESYLKSSEISGMTREKLETSH
jgi:glucosamine 6-phosphate synthetase-like amidotransferase/phosphosugar isomerase protein